MSVENPYTSPTTELSDAPAGPTDWRTLLFSFDGRVPRRVYWGVTISLALIYLVFVMLARTLFGDQSAIAAILILVLWIPQLWISLAVNVKRWHDREKSGWWILINFIPIIGGIWSFVEVGCLRGTVGRNLYGPDPT